MCRDCEPPPPPLQAASPRPAPPVRRPTRRDLLRLSVGAAAGIALPHLLGASLGRALAGEPAPAAPVPGAGRADQVLFLYMNGGASQFETLDPKPGTTTGGPTRTVPTTLPGVHLADSLPGLARRTDRLCLVRSMTSAEGNHERARYLLHTGHAPNPTVTHAAWGAIVSHELGDPSSDVPAHVSIGGPGAGAGYLGVRHAPFVVRDARRPLADMEMPRGLTTKRRDARLDLLGRLGESFARERGDRVPKAQEAMFERARRLMDSPRLEAFDLSREKEKTREAYGGGRLGPNVLLARRLLEIGVPFVEVMMDGWDTHEDNFGRVKALNGELDQALSALLDDLAASGRLARTLVVWVGDFGRTPQITGNEGRGHYPRAWSIALAGGGVQGGRVVGATDPLGREVVERPVTVPDLFASLAHALGIDPTRTFHDNGRPLTLVDSAGRPVRELFEA